MRYPAWLPAACVMIATASCSAKDDAASTDDGGASANDAGATVSACGADAGVVAWAPSLRLTSASGAYAITIGSAQPVSPAKGTNAWTFTLTDAAGAPVDGATFTVKPYMPAHGHGSSVTPSVAAMGGGVYAVSDVVLFMPGVWQITLTFTAPKTDALVFSVCIEG